MLIGYCSRIISIRVVSHLNGAKWQKVFGPHSKILQNFFSQKKTLKGINFCTFHSLFIIAGIFFKSLALKSKQPLIFGAVKQSGHPYKTRSVWSQNNSLSVILCVDYELVLKISLESSFRPVLGRMD